MCSSLRTLACVLVALPFGSAFAQTSATDLDARAELAIARMLDPAEVPSFTMDFILSDVRLDRTDPRRFYNFSGDLSGRYLEVMSLLDLSERLEDGRFPGGFTLSALADSILAQQQADGRFGDPALTFTADEIGGEHMALLWGNGRLLVGLMAYYRSSGRPEVLAAARRLGDFFILTAEASRKPDVVARLEGFGAKGIICFTQYIEGLVMLAEDTRDPRYTAAAIQAYTILPERGQQHTHGYLSTLRGVADLYRLTQNPAHLAYVRGLFDDLLASTDYTLYGAVHEYFGAPPEGGRGEHRDEGCSSADFLRLALQLYQITGDARYRTAAAYAVANALLPNQYANGDFGTHYFGEGVMRPSNPSRAWWCCTMHGLRAIIAVEREYAFASANLRFRQNEPDQQPGAPELSLLLPMSFAGAGFAGRLEETVDEDARFVYTLSLKLVPPQTPLVIRLPGAEAYTDWQNGSEHITLAQNGETLTVERPVVGQVYRFSAAPKLRLVNGPLSAAEVPTSDEPAGGALVLGHYLLGTRTDAYVSEPDNANQIDYPTLRPMAGRIGVTGKFREGGFAGLYDVELVPVATQTAAGHPYMRVETEFAVAPGFRSPDR